jgi:hypothetical protein
MNGRLETSMRIEKYICRNSNLMVIFTFPNVKRQNIQSYRLGIVITLTFFLWTYG